MHENLREVGGAAFRILCMRSGECPAAFSFSLAGVWMSVNFGHQTPTMEGRVWGQEGGFCHNRRQTNQAVSSWTKAATLLSG